MKEKFIRSVFLPDDLSTHLLDNGVDGQVVERVEELAQADFQKALLTSFMGAVANPLPQRGEVQAEEFNQIARLNAVKKIGGQALYWRKYHEQIASGEGFCSQLINLNMLEVGDGGEIWVVDAMGEEDKYEYDLYHSSAYSGYVMLSNMAGDADFWGISRPHIFPVRVRVGTLPYDKNEVWAEVSAASLGIEKDIEVSTWEAWKNLSKSTQETFSRSLRALMDSGKLVDEVALMICREDRSGNVITHEITLYRQMVFDRFSDREIIEVRKQIYDKMREVTLSLGPEDGLIKSSRVLADELEAMWGMR